ncbi:MAG: hypothetical protein HYY02_12010 [Chloroflexi bacterium]|nr:hypothetical protein [Chloroflexota bacterium]
MRQHPWLLLIYSVPAQPSRKRAFVWREVKRVGAVYLRDGVCVLPQTAGTEVALTAIAQRILEFEGRATIVRDARLEAGQVSEIRTQMQAARAAEYTAVSQDAEAFLEHIRRETDHRDFSFAELQELEADLQKLQRWYEQVRSRDYVNEGGDASIDDALRLCEEALSQFTESAAREENTP